MELIKHIQMNKKASILQALVRKDKDKIKSLIKANRLHKHIMFITGKNGAYYYEGDIRIDLSLSEKKELITKYSKEFDLTIIDLPDNGR